VPELPMPLFLYNMPALTKVAMEPETVRRAMDDRRIIGIKDSSCSMIYLHRILALLPHRPDWPVLVGPEEMLSDAVFAGAHGGVNGGANLFPKLYVKLFEAARAGDIARARELHALVMRVSENLYRIGKHSSAIIKGIKGALAISGICDDFMAEPFQRFREPERARVRQVLDELNPLVNKL
jgi:4-hydroxy-tetrahydrodipicolinate synthase